MRKFAFVVCIAMVALADDLPKGQIIDEVKCAADASETYALYLPSNYSPDGAWSVIFAFDPRARGRMPVEVYQAAAEKYGYIVAGSNNSKNGPWAVSLAAAQAMLADVSSRFSVDPKRFYATGLSGGARVSMALGISGGGKFAGVIASSAGMPDNRPRTSLDFPVFATTGTGDFNFLEMRRLDRALTSPHRLRVFDGGHAWPPGDVAMEAVEWFEIQAMKSGVRGRDESFLDKMFAARKAAALALTDSRGSYVALSTLVADFDGLRDVHEFAARAEALSRDKDVQKALKEERNQDQHELQLYRELAELAAGLDNPATRRDNLEELRNRLTKLAHQARASEDSADRQQARRTIWTMIVDNSSREDPELDKLLKEVRPTERP
jgi:dienelactone hydrolase